MWGLSSDWHICLSLLRTSETKGRATSIEIKWNISKKLNFPLKMCHFQLKKCKKRNYVIPWIRSFRHADLAFSKCEETPSILGKKACDTFESFLVSLRTRLVLSSHSQNAKYHPKFIQKRFSRETFHFCSKKTHSLAIKKSWLMSVGIVSKAFFSIAWIIHHKTETQISQNSEDRI